jgi:hypothetical protein
VAHEEEDGDREEGGDADEGDAVRALARRVEDEGERPTGEAVERVAGARADEESEDGDVEAASTRLTPSASSWRPARVTATMDALRAAAARLTSAIPGCPRAR